MLNQLNRTALKLRSFFIFIFFEVIFHFSFFLRLSSIFFGGCLSSWVKIRLHTENQLPRLPGSALKVSGGGGVGGCLPILKSSTNFS